MEIYDDGRRVVDRQERDATSSKSLPHYHAILNFLRGIVDNSDILGSGIFTTDGNVIYSSLPSESLTNTIKEFEIRKEKRLSPIRNMFLVLENNQKICSNYMKIGDKKYILVLFFADRVKIGLCTLSLQELVDQISRLEEGP